MIAAISPTNQDALRVAMEQQKRIASLKARLREWEDELQRKKDALTTSGRKLVEPIFKDKPRHSRNDDLDEDNDDQSLDMLQEDNDDYGKLVTKNKEDQAGRTTKDALQGDLPELDIQLALQELGEGPMRFSRELGERSFREQVASLSTPNRQCYENLVHRWQHQQQRRSSSKKQRGGFALPNEWILRFARNNVSSKDSTLVFRERRAWKAMCRFQRHYLALTVYQLEDQLLTKTLFPVPGLKTAGGHDMFYMKPSRYFPKETSTKTIIDNLAYVMTTMLQRSQANCQNGIGFVANMDDWAMCNFDVNYCFQYMMCLQGFMVPVKVELFLIVNPPSWFGIIWKIMRPMLSTSFCKKVKVILSDKLHKYLQAGFEEYLPDEMDYGKADTDQIVQDFVCYRKYYELKTGLYNQDHTHHDISLSESLSSDLSLTNHSRDSSNGMPKTMSSSLHNDEDPNQDSSRSSDFLTEEFTPEIAMKRSKASFLSEFDGVGWCDLDFEAAGWSERWAAAASSRQLSNKNDDGSAKDNNNLEDDASIFDDDLSLLDDSGW